MATIFSGASCLSKSNFSRRLSFNNDFTKLPFSVASANVALQTMFPLNLFRQSVGAEQSKRSAAHLRENRRSPFVT
jgi:hypothetical protein